MIGRVVRGWRAHGLLAYLFGPGRANEHTDPHLVASWDEMPDRLQPPVVGIDGAGHERFDVTELTALITLPAQLAGVPQREPRLGSNGTRPQGPVWHCSMRTAPDDRELSDAEWADIAADVMHRTGIAPRDDPGACRWVAVRHAPDHIHIAAVLVRTDTERRVHPRFDHRRVREACLAAEERYGLTPTSPANGTATPATTRAEREKAARTRLPPPREHLRDEVRRALRATNNLAEFIAKLTTTGVVLVDTRVDEHGRLTGYKVASTYPHVLDDERIWFSGATLAPDLSGLALQHRWDDLSTGPAVPRPRDHADRAAAPTPVQLLDTATDMITRAHAAFSTATALTCAGLTPPADGTAASADEELTVLAPAVVELLDRLDDLDRNRSLHVAVADLRLAAGRPPNWAGAHTSRWAPLARDLRLASRDLASIAMLGLPDRKLAAAALLIAVAGLAAEIAAWREQHRRHAATHAARRAHITIMTHRLITHPPRATTLFDLAASRAPTGLPVGEPVETRRTTKTPTTEASTTETPTMAPQSRPATHRADPTDLTPFERPRLWQPHNPRPGRSR